jgi:hypothetical protein
MDSRAAKGTLLYVSDSSLGDVFAFTWPKLHLIGNLSALSQPQGECVDRSGNIWIANTNKFEMLAFGHGGVKPIETLADPDEYPIACSVSASGDLAVTNILSKQGGGYGPGSLSIYKAAKGRPTVFSDPTFSKVFFDGYDERGNLFVDGQKGSGAFALAEFDGKSFTALKVSGATINFPGSIQVTGAYVNLEDQGPSGGNSVIYRTTLRGTTLTVDSAAHLLDGMDCIGSYIYGVGKLQRAICPNGTLSAPSVNVYKYPAGGSPIKVLDRNVLAPDAAVVSP